MPNPAYILFEDGLFLGFFTKRAPAEALIKLRQKVMKKLGKKHVYEIEEYWRID